MDCFKKGQGPDPLDPPPRCSPEKSLKAKKSFVAKKQPPEVLEAEASIFIIKQTLTQRFPCEFNEILPENLWVTASGSW